MTAVEMMPLKASFEHQEQAEEAIRKLASLRADRFRMERAVHGPEFGSAVSADTQAMSGLAEQLLSGASIEAAEELGTEVLSSASPFSLSAHVPQAAAEQARQVVEAAGGTIEE